MPVRSLRLLVIGVLFLTACQPTVGLSPRITDLPDVRVESQPLIADEAGRPLMPSAEEGRKVFEGAQRCVQCHGVEGVGDGPLSKGLVAPQKNPFTDTMRLLGIEVQGEKLPSRPANFHNLVQMRLNSPFSMFETVTLGRAHTAMPAFGPRPAYGANDGMAGYLTDAQRWHVLFYEWTFATTPQNVALGRTIYEGRALPVTVEGLGPIRTTCAGCHGARGDGRGGEFSQVMGRTLWGWNLQQGVGIFVDRDFMVKRKPTELFARIADGHGLMPGYRPAGDPSRHQLTVDEIWALVDYLWTFVYRYTPPRGQQP
ncbi:MAG TPA: cytochrome c [bacterium]|jgi:mono/diheme cytochrome c family protein|nr:cytochrome c [bacterium]